MAHFPEGFLWGASTAAHQVEGNNTNSDFWLMENLEGSVFKEPSGSAVDHYNRFKSDITEMAKLGLNSYRFSIEWARIEPEEGQFEASEIEHYREVLLACKENNITPIVTLHHFSSPQWLIRLGGWESADTPARFARYCTHVMGELGELMPYVCTINEANISIGIKKIMKRYELKSGSPGAQVGMNMEKMAAQMQKYYVELSKAFGVPPTEVHSFLAPRSEEGLAIIFCSMRRFGRSSRRDLSFGLMFGTCLISERISEMKVESREETTRVLSPMTERSRRMPSTCIKLIGLRINLFISPVSAMLIEQREAFMLRCIQTAIT